MVSRQIATAWYEETCDLPGALGNGLKRLESAKVGLVANSMQNSIRNMTGTLFLMCGGLILSKLRILDSTWKGNFNLVGIRVWQEIHFTDVSCARTSTTPWISYWRNFWKLQASNIVDSTTLPPFFTGTWLIRTMLNLTYLWFEFAAKPRFPPDRNPPSRGHLNP